MKDTVFMDEQAVSLQAARDRAKAGVVIHLVALATGISPREILDTKRAGSDAARARWLAVYLTHVGFSIPLARVAAAFGRDRTTVSYAVHQVEDWRDDAAFDVALTALEACVGTIPAEVTPLLPGGSAA